MVHACYELETGVKRLVVAYPYTDICLLDHQSNRIERAQSAARPIFKSARPWRARAARRDHGERIAQALARAPAGEGDDRRIGIEQGRLMSDRSMSGGRRGWWWVVLKVREGARGRESTIGSVCRDVHEHDCDWLRTSYRALFVEIRAPFEESAHASTGAVSLRRL